MVDIGKVRGRIVIDYEKDYSHKGMGISEPIKFYVQTEEDVNELIAMGLLELAKIQFAIGGYMFLDLEGNILYDASAEEDDE
jgi:hypothetical protein